MIAHCYCVCAAHVTSSPGNLSDLDHKRIGATREKHFANIRRFICAATSPMPGALATLRKISAGHTVWKVFDGDVSGLTEDWMLKDPGCPMLIPPNPRAENVSDLLLRWPPTIPLGKVFLETLMGCVRHTVGATGVRSGGEGDFLFISHSGVIECAAALPRGKRGPIPLEQIPTLEPGDVIRYTLEWVHRKSEFQLTELKFLRCPVRDEP